MSPLKIRTAVSEAVASITVMLTVARKLAGSTRTVTFSCGTENVVATFPRKAV